MTQQSIERAALVAQLEAARELLERWLIPVPDSQKVMRPGFSTVVTDTVGFLAEARVRELETENLDIRNLNAVAARAAHAAEAECAALRAEVAAEEKAAAAMVKGARDAAEFHLRNSDAEYDRRIAAESRLAAANALLERVRKDDSAPQNLIDEIDSYLAAQLTTSAPTHAALVAQVAELTAELAEQKAIVSVTNESFCVEVQLRLAAEAQVAELTRDPESLVAQLEAARGLLDRAIAKPRIEWADDVRRYLSGHFPYADLAFARVAESECASLRLQLEAARGVAESECAALRAEVERLRGYVTSFEELTAGLEPHDMLAHWHSDRARLATANALLGRWQRKRPLTDHSLDGDTRAHLAAQPAPLGSHAADLQALRATQQQLAAANALLVDALPANVCKAPWLTRRDEHFDACGFNPVKSAHLAAQPATAPAAPVEANLRAQLKAANIQIKSLERDILELRVAVDIKTDEIERVRTILGPTAGLNES